MTSNINYTVRLLLIYCAFGAVCGSAAWSPSSPVISEIEPASLTAETVFVFKNTSSKNVSLLSVYPLCDCVKASFSTNSIKPGDTSSVTLRYQAFSPGAGKATGFRAELSNGEVEELHWQIKASGKSPHPLPSKSTGSFPSSNALDVSPGLSSLKNFSSNTTTSAPVASKTRASSDIVLVWQKGDNEGKKKTFLLPEGFSVLYGAKMKVKTRPMVLFPGQYEVVFEKASPLPFFDSVVFKGKNGELVKTFYINSK